MMQLSQSMHGQYIIHTDRYLISEEDAFLWLWIDYLTAESDSDITAAQETEHYATQMLKTETVSKCKPCTKYDETLDHFISVSNIGKRTICNVI